MQNVLKQQASQQKTDANRERKLRIINALIDNKDKSFVCIQLHREIFDKFQHFVKVFQSQKPVCHLLHCELFSLIKEFYSMFLTSESIPKFSGKKLHC